MHNITTPKSYTNKDFNSIYVELLDIVKQLSSKWDPTISTESDPGVILLKADAIIADKNNYNIDKNILEVFPQTVTQDINARNIYKQMGYNMSWYRSATGELGIRWIGEDLPEGASVKIPKFTMFTDAENKYVYTLLEDVVLDSDVTVSSGSIVEGIIVDLVINNMSNIPATSIDDNNRLYLPDYVIAQNGIFISNSSDPESYWEQVSNLYVQPLGKKMYEFCVDVRNSSCYLQFPEDVADLIGEGLNIKYLLSSGSNGNVGVGELTAFYEDVTVSVAGKDTVLGEENVTVSNLYSITNGENPEDLSEAYKNYQRTVGTFDTLVTVRDYLNAVLKTGKVSNGFVTDRLNDPQCSYYVITNDKVNSLQLYVTGSETLTLTEDDKGDIEYQSKKYAVQHTDDPDMTAFDLKLYLMHNPSVVATADGYERSFQLIADGSNDMETIKSSVLNTKCVQHDIIDKLPDKPLMFINKYPLEIKILPHQKLSETEIESVRTNIVVALREKYNSSKVEFGVEPDYNEVYDTIETADPRIKAVVLGELGYETYYCYYDSATKEFKEVALLGPDPDSKNICKEIITKSVLKGVTPWFVRDSKNDIKVSDIFLGEGETSRVCSHLLISPFATGASYTEDDKDTGTIRIPKPDGKDEYWNTGIKLVRDTETKISNYILGPNESIRCYGPSFITDQTYSNYVKFELVLGDSGRVVYTPVQYSTKEHANTSSIRFLISKKDKSNAITSYTEEFTFGFENSAREAVKWETAKTNSVILAETVTNADEESYVEEKYTYGPNGKKTDLAKILNGAMGGEIPTAIANFENHLRSSAVTKLSLSSYKNDIKYYVVPKGTGGAYSLQLVTAEDDPCQWALIHFNDNNGKTMYSLAWCGNTEGDSVWYIGSSDASNLGLTHLVENRAPFEIYPVYSSKKEGNGDVTFDNTYTVALKEYQKNSYNVGSTISSGYTVLDLKIANGRRGEWPSISLASTQSNDVRRYLSRNGTVSVTWTHDSELSNVMSIDRGTGNIQSNLENGKYNYNEESGATIPLPTKTNPLTEIEKEYGFDYISGSGLTEDILITRAWQAGEIILYRVDTVKELPADCDYQLGTNDTITFFWRTEEGDNVPYHYRKYTGGDSTNAFVLKPSFRLKATNLDSALINHNTLLNEGTIQCGEKYYKEVSSLYGENDLSGTKQIEMRKMNQLFMDPKDKYYLITNRTIDDSSTGTPKKKYVMTFKLVGDPVKVGEEKIGTYSHILEQDELFIRCYKSGTGYEILRAGTLICFKKSTASDTDVPTTVDLEVYTLGAESSDIATEDTVAKMWENAVLAGSTGISDMFYREQQIYNIVEGDTLHVMRDDQYSDSLPQVEFNSWEDFIVPQDVTIRYTPANSGEATELPMIHINDSFLSSWVIRAALNVNSSPDVAQKITPVRIDPQDPDNSYKSFQFFMYRDDTSKNEDKWVYGNELLIAYLKSNIEDFSISDLSNSFYLTSDVNILKVGGSNVDVTYANLMDQRISPEVYLYTSNDVFFSDPYKVQADGSVVVDFDKYGDPEQQIVNEKSYCAYPITHSQLMRDKYYLLTVDGSEVRDKDNKLTSISIRYHQQDQETLTEEDISNKFNDSYTVLYPQWYTNAYITVLSETPLKGKLVLKPLIRFNLNENIIGTDKHFSEYDDIKASIDTLDKNSLFKYDYEVPEDVSILDPLSPISFFDENHIYNKFTIPKAHFYDSSSKKNALGMITIIGNR